MSLSVMQYPDDQPASDSEGDSVRAIADSDTAVHYRATGEGRALYRLLRDDIREGIHYTDLQRILGPFKLFGPVDHDYTTSAAPGYPDFDDVDIASGHFWIEYRMSYWRQHLQIQDGHLVNHDPALFNEYPDGLVLNEGEIESVTRPLDEGPLPSGSALPMLDDIWERIIEKEGRDGIDSLSDDERRVYFVYRFLTDQFRNGFNGFLYNISPPELGVPWLELRSTIDAVRSFHRDSAAALLEQARGIVEQNNVSTHTESWERYILRVDPGGRLSKIESALEMLCEDLWDDIEDLTSAMQA